MQPNIFQFLFNGPRRAWGGGAKMTKTEVPRIIMKKLVSLFVVLVTLVSGLSAQSGIRFAAQDSLGQYTQLHHVTIQNMTRDWVQQLYYPDTVWVTSDVGVHSYDPDKFFCLYQNVPNPFNGATEFSLNLPYKDQVNVVIHELSGHVVSRFAQVLPSGLHTFRVMLQKPQIYLLTVTTNHDKASIKMVNIGGSLSGIRYVSADAPHAVSLKAQMSDPDYPFEPGDDMLYVGYVLTDSNLFMRSDTIRQLQFNMDEEVVLHFLRPADLAYPEVTTMGVSAKEGSLAVCVGEITQSGNATLSARGFCWSTSPNPTLNDPHTSESPSIGIFRDTINNLQSDVTYYYRAYAVNEVGVAYGADKTFVLSSDTSCPVTVTDYDGNVYETVQLGSQCWMRDNLKTRHFADGTEILIQTQVANNYVTPSYWIGGDTNVYGRIYNFPAAVNCEYLPDSLHILVQGICPDGWHLPSRLEWQSLFSYVSSNPAYHCNGSSSRIAKSLAYDGLWHYYNESCTIGNDLSTNNATGFSMKPAGMGGAVVPPGTEALFWTSSAIIIPGNDPKGYTIDFLYFDDTVEEAIYSSSGVWAMSVRCLRD